jgi:hypothetical protein
LTQRWCTQAAQNKTRKQREDRAVLDQVLQGSQQGMSISVRKRSEVEDDDDSDSGETPPRKVSSRW